MALQTRTVPYPSHGALRDIHRGSPQRPHFLRISRRSSAVAGHWPVRIFLRRAMKAILAGRANNRMATEANKMRHDAPSQERHAIAVKATAGVMKNRAMKSVTMTTVLRFGA
ncbi:hypothetical protein SAMN05421771_3048 [Granulicella pectinivorans]|uniref:Uncharacterized protein n=1 Tax=Granulicella pectinivorans TaxID=474950 RepID=A0A1I6MN28_9BACT|nr:hypothetical protein SAMN05421771_3048 [Granulicella pectinivorans]